MTRSADGKAFKTELTSLPPDEAVLRVCAGETLLAYNLQDAINLEALMVTAYNLKLRQTPFYERLELPMPVAFPNPMRAHRETIHRYRSEASFIRSLQPQW